MFFQFSVLELLASAICRMKSKKAKERKEAAAELEQNIHLVKAPGAMVAEPGLTLPTIPEKMKVKVEYGKQHVQQMES